MKQFLILLTTCAMLFSLNGCTDDFEEMNQSKSSLYGISKAELFLTPLLTRGYTQNYQRAYNLQHDLYAQYFANMNPNFKSGYYAQIDGWISTYWKNFYTEHVILNEIQMREIAEKNEAYNDIYQIGRIWKLYLSSSMVDTWGDIPYFDAGKGELSVKYDKDEDVYRSIIADLKDAVNAFKGDASQIKVPTPADPIYNGNINKWKKFANSVRATLALRMVNFDPTYSKTVFEECVVDGMIISPEDNAVLLTDNSFKNELINFSNWVENGMSATIEDYFKNTSSVVDPRMSIWFQERGKGGYKGIGNGDNINANKNTNDYSVSNRKYWSHETPFNILLSSDCKFMLAEAKLRDWNVSSTIQDLYNEGVKDNLLYWGVSSDEADAYVTGLPAFSGDKENQLKQIIVQRWLGYFPNGRQGWSIFRRTDYPELSPVISNVSPSIPDGHFIKRLRYIESEIKLNELCPIKEGEVDDHNKRIFWDTSDDQFDNFK